MHAEHQDETLLLVPVTRRVLIVDDDQDFAQNLALALKMRDYVVAVAFDVEGAIARVAEHTPEVAILDIRLGSASGIDLIPILRARAPARARVHHGDRLRRGRHRHPSAAVRRR